MVNIVVMNADYHRMHALLLAEGLGIMISQLISTSGSPDTRTVRMSSMASWHPVAGGPDSPSQVTGFQLSTAIWSGVVRCLANLKALKKALTYLSTKAVGSSVDYPVN